MRPRVRWVILTSALLATAVLATVWAPWAVSAAPACEQPPRITAPNAQKQNRPVVLVHGWDGNGASMDPIGAYLTSKTLHLAVKPFYFDYSSHNTDWAARPTVAGCLAAYITAISKSYKAAGGDGKVIVIAHSMGGLAIRFASSSQFVQDPVGADLAGVITIDTPSLGSPFGDQTLSRALQAIPGLGGGHPTSLFHAPAGSDASICLAMHQPPSNELPSGCAAAPYLPAGIPITQLAGDMVVSRTFFGVHLYTIDLGTDGPVPVDSAHGYVNSGQNGAAPSGTQATDQPTVSCTVDFDQVAQLAAGEGAAKNGPTGVAAGFGDLLSPTIFADAKAVDGLQSGQMRSQLLGFLLAAYSTAPCSHSGMLTDTESLKDIAGAVKNDLAHPGNPIISAGRKLSASSTCADWNAASFSERSAFAATVSPGVQLDTTVPSAPEQHAAFMYGFIGGGCDRAKSRGLAPAAVSLQEILSGHYLSGSSTTTTSASVTSSQASGSFTPARSWSWDTTNSNGYTSHYDFEIGTPVRLSSAPIMPGFTQQSDISGACTDFNPQTDAVLPVQLTLTNTSSGFSKDVSTFFDLQESFASNALSELEVASGYSAGVQCETMQQQTAGNDQSNWAVDCQLEPNASCTNYSYFILKNYFSPNAPSGDPSALDPMNISVADTTTTSQESVTGVSGPGAHAVLGYAVYIPLSGTAPSGG